MFAFTWLLTLSIIVSDAPRWFSATKIDFISLSERADETTLSFPSASIKLIPFLCAANATLCTSLYALNRGMPFLISASNTNSEKIHGQDDMQRKHPIRELAMDYGVPEVAAQKQKKALQYGSQIHKSLLKSRKTS